MINLPNYQLLQQIYEGLCTKTYRALRLSDDQSVILKVLQTDGYDATLEAKFAHEFNLLQTIDSGAVIKAYEIFPYHNKQIMVLEDFGGESLFYLQPYLAALSLQKKIDLLISIAQTVEQLHSHNIIHKNINPANIAFNINTNVVKLIDLGLSVRLSREMVEHNSAQQLSGTLSYIAPEQTGKMNCNIDYRTDFYSIGITFYELLANHLPFSTQDSQQLIYAHMAVVAPTLWDKNKKIPKVLSDIVAKLIEKSPDQRYQSINGLIYDLEKCAQTLTDESIESFAIGTQDFSPRLIIPQKFYGRDIQLEKIMETFAKVVQGNSEMLLIKGHPGTGKSSIAHEIQRPLSYGEGYFIKGKCEELRKEIPYYPFIQAFQELIRHILAEPEERVTQWRTKIQSGMGSNAALLLNIIPELSHILGTQIYHIEISPDQLSYQMNHELAKFVSLFCSDEKPLVIFLDDLQWIDSSSLQLMEYLVSNPDMKYLFFIGAFRDNHLHPITSFSDRNLPTGVQLLELLPLETEDISQFLADTLVTTLEKTQELAQLCKEKTQGNPFFLTQFLHLLIEKGFLYPYNTKWAWDIELIKATAVTENMVDLLVNKIINLPPDTQYVLQIAAALGMSFDLKSICAISTMSESVVTNILWECIQDNFIVSVDSFIPHMEPELTHYAIYKFLHERVQQACYKSTDKITLQCIHLAIFRFWSTTTQADDYMNSTEAHLNYNIFDLLNHITVALPLVETHKEFCKFLDITLLAAKKSKTAGAYRSALNYLKVAQDSLALHQNISNFTIPQHTLFSLYQNAAECSYLNGSFLQVDYFAALALPQSMGIIGEAKIKLLQIKALFSQDKLAEGIEQGLILLERFGMVFPKKNIQMYAVAMLLRMEVGLNKAAITNAQKKPNTSNPHINMIVEILGAISVPIFYANPKFYLLTLLAQIKICLAHGITPTSPYVFASYGAILSSRLGKFARAAQFAQLATVLQENQENKIGKCRTDFVVSAMIDPWNKNIHDILPALYNNYHLALQSGDAEFAESSIQAYTYYSLFAGKNLDALITDITTYFSRKDQIIRPSIQLGISLLKKGIGYLTDSLPSEEQIEPVFFSSEDFNNMKADKMSKVLMFQYCSLQIRLAVQFNRPLLALRYIAALKPHLSSYQGLFGFTSYCFYESLALMFLVKTMSPRRRYQALRNVKKNQRNFEKWMKSCPTNFSHLWHLVEAEICKFRNQEKQALFHYEEAIRMAKLNNFSNVVALAQELLGEFYVQRGYEFSGVTCLIESQHQYIKWGAKAKVEHIQRKYPHLYGLKNISKDLRSISPQTELQHGFDVITLLKATQTLSQEIILSKLLKRLVAIVVENSGAQKALLLLKQDNSWTIEAYKKSADSPIEVIYDTYLDTNTLGNEYIPISLFNYVVQSKTSAIIGNAVEDSIVMQDYYVEKNLSKSLLLTPMFYQGNLIGLVFLETNLGTYIFNQNHLEILHIISAQAAISIENARLYANMEKRIAERTQQIKELSYIDSLTNVPNRKAFDEKVTEEFERAKRSYQPLSILIIDIDHFKKVNDTYGHLAGDECLKLMGTTLTELKKRTTDFVARYGGEEFIFILPLTDLPGAIDFAQGILRAVQQIVFKIGDITHPITVSIGVACKNKDNNIEPKDLISLADKSLYIAKEQGRNRVVSS